MTPIQEAYALMQHPSQEETENEIKRTGLSKGLIDFPADFDEHFDDLNSEISDLFSGGN